MVGMTNTYQIDDHGRRHLISTMLKHYAGGLVHPAAILPTNIVMHTHDLTANQLLLVADTYNLKISILAAAASVTRVLETGTGLDFTMEQVLYSRDLSAESREAYEAHNKHCLELLNQAPDSDPDPDPVATQPMSAGYL